MILYFHFELVRLHNELKYESSEFRINQLHLNELHFNRTIEACVCSL